MDLNYRKYGSQGESVIILHGLFGNLNNWHTIASELGKTYNVFTLDLRNHGKSPHSTVFNYEVMAQDVIGFMNQHAIQGTAVMGHSLGGKVAMQISMHYPDRVNAMVSVDMLPVGYEPVFEDVFRALRLFNPAEYSTRAAADSGMKRYLPDEGIRQFLLQNLERDASGRFTWRMNLPVLQREYPSILEEVTGPPYRGRALFISGGKSGYVKRSDEGLIKVLFPAAELVEIPGAGHWVHVDAGPALLKTVKEFLPGR